MPSLLSLLGISAAVIILKYDWKSYYSELPVFISQYRKSDTYWISALIGAYYGGLLPNNSTLFLTGVFFIPLVSYYFYHRPFGLSCMHRPVDENRNVIDPFAERENIVEMKDGEWPIKLRIAAGRHIDKYRIRFDIPKKTDISFVDYWTDKVQNFDDAENVLEVESEREDDFVVGVYVTPNGKNINSDRSFVVTEADTDQVLSEVTMTK